MPDDAHLRSSQIWCDISDGVIYEKPLSGGGRLLYKLFGHGFVIPQLQNILIAILALYCCFMVNKVSVNSGFFLLPFLFVLQPLVFRGRKKESREEEQSGLELHVFRLQTNHRRKILCIITAVIMTQKKNTLI